MPSSSAGFTGNEIVSRVQSFVGNWSTSFLTFVQETLPLAEFRFCKMHDWKFLKKIGLSLTVTNGQSEYDLSVANIGYYMQVDDVESIYDVTEGIYLKKVDLNYLRRLDAEADDGSSASGPTMWAATGDNQITLYPAIFKTGTLKIDGKITPVALQTLSNTPTIPYRYQEAFIEYVIAIALDRENDTRAASRKKEALQLIQLDINDDMASMANTDEPRIRSRFELVDGAASMYNPLSED